MRVNDKKVNNLIYDTIVKMVDELDGTTYFNILETGVEKWYIKMEMNDANNVVTADVFLYRGIECVGTFPVVECVNSELLKGGKDLIEALAEKIRFRIREILGI